MLAGERGWGALLGDGDKHDGQASAHHCGPLTVPRGQRLNGTLVPATGTHPCPYRSQSPRHWCGPGGWLCPLVPGGLSGLPEPFVSSASTALQPPPSPPSPRSLELRPRDTHTPGRGPPGSGSVPQPPAGSACGALGRCP